jgi:prepilin-type N-terminal cleavage/methylation domain-containing protein
MERPGSNPDDRGLTLMEVMVAMVILSIGILAIARVIAAGSRSQSGGRMESVAGQYANEQFEQLRGVVRSSPSLSAGRHPVSDYETLGASGAWKRCYVVTALPAPLDSLLRLDTTVLWTSNRPESVHVTGYLMP